MQSPFLVSLGSVLPQVKIDAVFFDLSGKLWLTIRWQDNSSKVVSWRRTLFHQTARRDTAIEKLSEIQPETRSRCQYINGVRTTSTSLLSEEKCKMERLGLNKGVTLITRGRVVLVLREPDCARSSCSQNERIMNSCPLTGLSASGALTQPAILFSEAEDKHRL